MRAYPMSGGYSKQVLSVLHSLQLRRELYMKNWQYRFNHSCLSVPNLPSTSSSSLGDGQWYVSREIYIS